MRVLSKTTTRKPRKLSAKHLRRIQNLGNGRSRKEMIWQRDSSFTKEESLGWGPSEAFLKGLG